MNNIYEDIPEEVDPKEAMREALAKIDDKIKQADLKEQRAMKEIASRAITLTWREF